MASKSSFRRCRVVVIIGERERESCGGVGEEVTEDEDDFGAGRRIGSKSIWKTAFDQQKQFSSLLSCRFVDLSSCGSDWRQRESCGVVGEKVTEGEDDFVELEAELGGWLGSIEHDVE